MNSKDYKILLTQYKRNNLERQLLALDNTFIEFKDVIVYQNENHLDLDSLRSKYNFQLIKSDFNTKFFGRFYHLLNYDVNYCLVMDDDIIPEKNFFKNIFKQTEQLNSIITGNGRLGYFNENKNKLNKPKEYGNKKNYKVDFGGHAWCFKQDWLYDAFSIKPYTLETGEDMHLCYSLRVLKDINTYTYSSHRRNSDIDKMKNSLSDDEHSSYKITNTEERKKVENYFIENYGLKLIESN